MSIASDGGRDVEAPVGEAARDSVSSALDVLAAMIHEELVMTPDDRATRERAEARLAEIAALRRQLEATPGPVRLVGSEQMVVSVVRAAASHAAYELDALVERLTGRPRPITEEEILDLRLHIVAAAGAVGTFVACESGRLTG